MSTETWNRGIAAVMARDTEHDTPTQILGGVTFPSVYDITGSVNPNIETPSMLGGPYPDHSQHWSEYFQGGGLWSLPMGDKTGHMDANKVGIVTTAQVADPQHQVTAGGHDFWQTFQNLVWRSMRNGNPVSP